MRGRHTEVGDVACIIQVSSTKNGLLCTPPSMTPPFDRILELAQDVESFELGRCGPSDDPDMQTAYLYSFKDIAKRFVGAARRLDDAELRAALSPLVQARRHL
jgi:hypothetical protein